MHVGGKDEPAKLSQRDIDQLIDEADKINLKSNQTWKRFYEKDYSYIVANFYSQLLGITSCTDCEYYTTNHDPIQVLSLEIPNEALTLDCCLNEYMKKYRLDSEKFQRLMNISK